MSEKKLAKYILLHDFMFTIEDEDAYGTVGDSVEELIERTEKSGRVGSYIIAKRVGTLKGAVLNVEARVEMEEDENV